jgi:hypothetical protein
VRCSECAIVSVAAMRRLYLTIATMLCFTVECGVVSAPFSRWWRGRPGDRLSVDHLIHTLLILDRGREESAKDKNKSGFISEIG